MITYSRLRLAALVSLLAAPCLAFAQFNPNPETCKCITIQINDGKKEQDKAGQQSEEIMLDDDGYYHVHLLIEVISGEACTPVKLGQVRLVCNNDSDTINCPAPVDPFTSYDQTIKIESSRVSSTDKRKWHVEVDCDGEPTTTPPYNSLSATDCKKDFNLGPQECDPCSGSTGSCVGTASSGCFTYKMPLGASDAGDTTGYLRFFTPDFTNPGLVGINAFVPASYKVTRTEVTGIGVVITKVETGNNTIELAATTPAGSDPNAFTVSHKDSNNNEFRVTNIYLVKDSNGIPLYLRVDSTYAGSTFRYQQSQPTPGHYVLESGPVMIPPSGPEVFTVLRVETLAVTKTANTEIHRKIVVENDATVSDIETTWEDCSWGWEKIKEVIEPDGTTPLTSTWSYFTGEGTGPAGSGDAGSNEGYGRLKEYVRYDGYMETHTYWTNNHQTMLPFAGEVQGLKLSRQWDNGHTTLTTIRTVGNKTLSEESATYTSSETAPTITTTSKASTGTALTTITTLMPYGARFGGQPASVLHPDGTLTTYEYEYTDADGSKTVTSCTTGTNGTVTEGTQTVTVTNRQGNVVDSTTTAVGTGDGMILDYWIVGTVLNTDIDSFGRPLKIRHFPSGATQAWTINRAYNCCGLVMETDRHGIPTYYAYDGLRRRIKSNSLGVTTETVHGGLITETHRYPETVDNELSTISGSSPGSLIARTTSNLTGTYSESWSPNPASTDNGALVATTTETTYANHLATRTMKVGRIDIIDDNDVHSLTPGTGSQTTVTYADGRIASTTGDLQPDMSYGYTVNDTSLVTTSAYAGGNETTVTTTDWAGRTTNVTKGTESTTYAYYSSNGPNGKARLGKLASVEDADHVRTLYDYNSIGERHITALSLNGDFSIDYGIDQITRTETFPAVRDDEAETPVLRTRTVVWKDGAEENGGAAVAYTDRTPDGLYTWSWQAGIGETSTHTPVGITRVETTIRPDDTYTTNTYSGGLLETTESFTADTPGVSIAYTTHTYDGLNRPETSTDSRTGTTTTAYVSNTCDAVLSMTPPAGAPQKTTFGYDQRGRRIMVDAPQSLDANNTVLDNITNTTYNPDGSVDSISGGQTYPVSYGYDYAGRRNTMTTYRTEGGTTTKWMYYTTTGRLSDKKYNYVDDDHPGSGPHYTYTDAGRLLTRSWVREVSEGVRVTTTYGYTNSLLTSVTYNDGTPGITYDYDAFDTDDNHVPGALETVTRDGRIWTYKYNATTLRPLSETLPVGGTAIARVLTRSFDAYGRPDGFQLGTSTDADLDHAVSYTPDNSGRYGEIAAAGKTFSYTYTPDSQHLIETVQGPADILVTNTWDENRDVLSVKNNTVDSATVSQFTYGVNNLGQRETVTTAGSAHGWSWGYDALGQVTKATNAANTDYNRAYAFDNIGNRNSATDGTGQNATTVDYTPNDLNQYEEIDSGTPVNPVCDADGNLRADAGINIMGYGLKFEWDAENRITAVRKDVTGSPLLATYTYDYLGRRIRKTTTSLASQGIADIAYLYDGFNVVAEYAITDNGASVALTQAYTWGLDLSGSMQGAGGVGGLLCIHRSPGIDNNTRTWGDSFYPTFDGNGNISEYLDEDGVEVAHFEYDPFGRIVRTTGTPEIFPYRFSTKPQDKETGLYYYGYRYYDPLTGRWPSRDPLGDNFFFWNYTRGLSIQEIYALGIESMKPPYTFVSNNPTNSIDLAGLSWVGVDVYKREIGSRINCALWFLGPAFHSFLEYWGESAGFSPATPADGIVGTGVISIPDSPGRNANLTWDPDSHRVARLWIDNCCIDLEKFENNLKAQLASWRGFTIPYVLLAYDCSAFADTAISEAIKISHKSDRPWLCNITEEWNWYAPSYNGL